MENEEFVREMCLLDVKMSASDEYEGYEKMETRLTIRKKDKKNFGSAAEPDLWSRRDRCECRSKRPTRCSGRVIFQSLRREMRRAGKCAGVSYRSHSSERRRTVSRYSRNVVAARERGRIEIRKERPFPENLMAKANKCPPCDGPRV